MVFAHFHDQMTNHRQPRHVIGGIALLALAACATTPPVPDAANSVALVLAPAALVNVRDERTRFREIFCATLAEGGRSMADHRPCDEALTRVGREPAATPRPVDLGPSRKRLIAGLVPGVGWACIADWLQDPGVVAQHVRARGYDFTEIRVDALSGSARNARMIRDAVLATTEAGTPPRLVLIGYSKGAPDILEAIVAYPDIRSRLAAVVSIAGAIGGSPLANDTEQSTLDLLRYWPGAQCDAGDGSAIESLRTGTRRKWLAEHPLPREVRTYSLVTLPDPARISSALRFSYASLSRIDARNDGQVIFYDQVIPGSTLLGYLNADHWAAAVPIARTHPVFATTLADRNAYPREALFEAVLRFVEEDLARTAR